RYRGDSAIRQQESHAVVSGFRTRCPPDGSRDRGYRPRILPRASFEHRRIDRERYLAANPEIEAEIAALYQGKPVPRGQPDALPQTTQAVRGATLATGEIKMQ